MMPVFNATRFIAASLESVLAQDFPSFEVVLYDDGSTDGTVDLVRERFVDGRLRVYRSARNRGVVYARNQILRLVRGEYLVPHDGDDVMLPARLRLQARCLDRHPDVGVVVGNFRITGWEGSSEPRSIVPWVHISSGRRRLHGRHEPGLTPLGVHHGAAMIRRSVLLAAGGYDRRWEGIEDSDLLSRLARTTRFYFLNRFAFVYQRRPDSLTGHLRTRSERPGRLLTPRERRFRTVLHLAGSRVEIVSDRARPLRVIRERLAHDPGTARSPDSRRRLGVELRFRAPAGRWADLGFDSQALGQLRWQGVTHRVDHARRSASVLIDGARRLPDEVIYHAGFLHPLSHAFHDAEATLAHAALLARDASGVLIMGESGSGKSTLGLAFLQRGYRYFSDEHPILAVQQGEVVGKRFANRIALSADSLRGFPELGAAASWSPRHGKWHLEPALVGAGGLGDTCRIDTVLFPRFRATARLTARRLSPLRFLWRLQQDEYYYALTRLGEGARAAREAHVRLLLRLVRSAVAFAITYGAREIPRVPQWLDGQRAALGASGRGPTSPAGAS